VGVVWPGQALLVEKKKVAYVPAVVAVAGCLLAVLMHACRPALWRPIRALTYTSTEGTERSCERLSRCQITKVI
jgi:hypothetical protein